MRLISLILCIALFLTTLWIDAPASAALRTIHLTASPTSIYADGRSICSISAEVRDGAGNIVDDGTDVHFTTSLGIIDTSAHTAGGVARVMLRSGIQPGMAMVSAVLIDGQGVSQLQVEFLTPGAKMDTDAYITISSDRYLAYAADSQTVDASGGVKVEHRGLKVEADSVQMDIGRNLLRARGKTGGDPIRISRGNKSITASLLCYDMNTLQGFMVADGADGKAGTLLFNGADLSAKETETATNQSAFDFTDLSETAVLVKAKSITIRPKHDLQFRKAELYMEGDKALKLPLYLIPLAAVGPAAGFQYFGVTSAGFKVDIPLYYSLTPTGTGAVRIRNQQGGWSSNSSLPGWGLDVEQSYATGGAEGRFTINQVTRPDWGLNWDHTQLLSSGATLYSNLQLPAHKNIDGHISFNKPFSGVNVGFDLQGSHTRFETLDPQLVDSTEPAVYTTGFTRNLSSSIYLQSNPRKFAKLLDYSVLLQTSFADRLTENSKTGTTASSGVTSGVHLQMRGTPISFGPKARLNTSLSVGNGWGGSQGGVSVLGNAMFTTPLGAGSFFGLGYSYTLTPSLTAGFPQHLLSFNYALGGQRWTVSLNGSRGLDIPTTSAYYDLGYRLNPMWRFSLRGYYQGFDLAKIDPITNLPVTDKVGSTDMEIGLGHMIGSQEVELLWSRSLHRFLMEMGSMGF